METINIHQAKTHLSRLIARAARGETIVIAKAGRPMVKLVPFETDERKKAQRVGFLVDAFTVPDDFDNMGRNDIATLFGAPS